MKQRALCGVFACLFALVHAVGLRGDDTTVTFKDKQGNSVGVKNVEIEYSDATGTVKMNEERKGVFKTNALSRTTKKVTIFYELPPVPMKEPMRGEERDRDHTPTIEVTIGDLEGCYQGAVCAMQPTCSMALPGAGSAFPGGYLGGAYIPTSIQTCAPTWITFSGAAKCCCDRYSRRAIRRMQRELRRDSR